MVRDIQRATAGVGSRSGTHAGVWGVGRQADTWQEVGRRLAALCQVGRMVQRSEGQASGGLDVALGPNVGATPIAALGPALVLQYLVAGAICLSPALSAAALPLVSERYTGR